VQAGPIGCNRGKRVQKILRRAGRAIEAGGVSQSETGIRLRPRQLGQGAEQLFIGFVQTAAGEIRLIEQGRPPG
jgi:hypothetical protein